MRRFHRFIILLLTLLVSSSSYAIGFLVEGFDWRATETNDWGYVNSETVPSQLLDYKTIDFSYRPGFRVGTFYTANCYPFNWDVLFSWTHYLTKTHDAEIGNIQPAFLGSVTAKPSHAYLYASGQVSQSIDFNMLDLVLGKQFQPVPSLILHPFVGLMGGWIYQTINAAYQGSTSTQEKIINNFKGIGPKAGVDVDVIIWNCQNFQPKLFASFASSWLIGRWNISDVTHVIPAYSVFIEGASHSMGAFALQGAIGFKFDYYQFSLKLAYEMSDWFDQCQFFDNDTGVHNNDLILQGATLGLSYNFT